MKEIKNILVICTGNSCRSIMAEAYFHKRIKEEDIPLEVKSAGTIAGDGFLPPEETLEMLKENNIDPDSYKSKRLTKEMIEWADKMLIMEPGHRASILNMDHNVEEKIHYLGEFNSERSDIIPDPIGRPLSFYRLSFRLIKNSIDGFIDFLKKEE